MVCRRPQRLWDNPIQLLLTFAIAAVLYAGGDRAEVMAERFGHRLAGVRGREAVLLAGRSIRSVALGVVVTALVQAIMTGAGLGVAGVPLPAVLTAVTFMLCIAQIGPGLVLIPAIVWLYWSGSAGWGTFLLVWSLVVLSIDNVVRPLLMRKGVHLPLVLLLAGRHWRANRLRPGRHLSRPSRARRRLHLAASLARRGPRPGRRSLTRPLESRDTCVALPFAIAQISRSPSARTRGDCDE